MDSETHPPLHFALFPFMAQGHMIPMLDIARLLAQRGVTVTIFTTPFNAARFEPVIKRAVQSGLPIDIVQLKFPVQEVGLPEGHENVELLDSMDALFDFYKAINLLEQPVEKLLEEMNPRPNCIISDFNFSYMNKIAKKFKIPKIVFHGYCCFCLLCTHVFRKFKIFDGVESESEYVTVPGLPDKVEFTRSQAPIFTYEFDSDSLKNWNDLMHKINDADESSYGVIVNTFRELEPEYVKELKKERDGRVWCIGPVSLCNKVGLDRVERGNKASIDQDRCLQWLDSQKTCSVLYVCLGSLCNLPLSQLKEIGLGLEESNRPFVWVLRKRDRSNELEEWISESGFEDRIRGRGLLIKGWAPQVLILSHRSVGGFLSHCGWNSILEGVSAGLPLVTWPLFGDQFCNEKLVVQILRVGVRVGVERPMEWGREESIGVLVDKEGVKRAIEELMGGGEEGEARRRRAKELAELAKKAGEEGGSSHSDITLLIHDITEQRQRNN